MPAQLAGTHTDELSMQALGLLNLGGLRSTIGSPQRLAGRDHTRKERVRLALRPGNGVSMKFKFELISPDGQNVGSFESTVLSWRPGDTVIASGNIAYRVVNVIRLKRISGVRGRAAERCDRGRAAGAVSTNPGGRTRRGRQCPAHPGVPRVCRANEGGEARRSHATTILNVPY